MRESLGKSRDALDEECKHTVSLECTLNKECEKTKSLEHELKKIKGNTTHLHGALPHHSS